MSVYILCAIRWLNAWLNLLISKLQGTYINCILWNELFVGGHALIYVYYK